MKSFLGEKIVVTGAANGLGREISKRFAQAGARVVGVDLLLAPLKTLEQEFPGKFIGFEADVTRRESIIPVLRQFESEHGPFDRLVANAGIGRVTPFPQFSASDFEAVIRVNLIGVANSIEAVLPGMIARRRGHIIGMASLASYRGLPFMSAYCASKSGVCSMLDSMSLELHRDGIDVSTICPGWIRTAMTKPLGKMPGMLEVDESVDRIMQAIERRRRFTAFPFRSAMMLRVMRWLPPALSDRLLRRLARKSLIQSRDAIPPTAPSATMT